MRIAVKTEIEVDDKVCLMLTAWVRSDLNERRGHCKVAMIKVVREVCGLGLREAKDVVDSIADSTAQQQCVSAGRF